MSLKVRDVWQQVGRKAAPRVVALVYFALGASEEESRQNLLRYYEPMGPDIAETIAGNALRSPDAVRGAVQAYEAAGVDELILDPSVSDPAQVDRLAEVIFG